MWGLWRSGNSRYAPPRGVFVPTFILLSHRVDTAAKTQRYTAANFSEDSVWSCYVCLHSPSRFILPAARMSPLEASLVNGQEIKSPTASQVPMEPSDLSRSPLPNPPPTSGNKRRRSSSSAESVRKRQSLLPESAPTTEPLKPLLPESNWHCSNCGRPCWGCFTRPEVPPDLESLNEEKDIDQLKMASSLPTRGPNSTRSGTTQKTTSTDSNKKRKLYEERGIKLVDPKKPDFRASILANLSVEVSYDNTASIDTKLTDIFSEEKSTPDSCVFLHKEDKQLKVITQDFAGYLVWGYDEHTLFTICTDSIVLRDPFTYRPVASEPTITKSVRRDKFRPGKEGPIVPSSQYAYDWDIEPDTTYAVSIQMFDAKHRKELARTERQSWLAESTAVCPYLTIEYKCTDKTGKASIAANQVIAASILWLYQRKRIRQELKCSLTDLRHYSITIVDDSYTIWEARFDDAGSYKVDNLLEGKLTTMHGLKLYIEWSNAIHSWGLGTNAISFKQDIVSLLDGRRGQQILPTPPSTLSSADATQQSGAF